ncbi:unnamed protein product [Parnassius apollo]|uniref:(apollo) hypothetical protein n=1 Tax=Parnassius apollo TaxID=110799 RepID=A0A8S3XCH9_PARAO|nr:unnamed protein product [Parnassius apollo]
MKGEMKRNATHLPQKPLHQYQVYEEVKEFMPEQPIHEGDEYMVQIGEVPDSFLLPPNQKPLTLQSVLRPNMPSKSAGNFRLHFRRPFPPEIILRRPPPHMNQKNNNGGYPLSMPNPHASHGMQKKPFNKYSNNRVPPTMNRQPLPNIPPMKSMPPLYNIKASHNKVPMKFNPGTTNLPNGSFHSITTGKLGHNIPTPPQSQTLSLGKTDIIANQVVKSQITLPGTSDAIAQHSVPQIFTAKPQGQGQIILGKLVENPIPLDQQMIQTKQQQSKTQYLPEIPQSSTPQIKHEQHPPQNEIKSSDFIGQSSESSTLRPAVNTGFKPDSIVIESGFKPIIREPLMAGEDRIADFGVENANRREDTDVAEDYEESPQYISNHAYPVQIPSDKITETFEPMFIPSPPDHLLTTNDRTKEIFPTNHAKEDRPHPVYLKTESELNALFGKKNMDKNLSSDLAMESDRVSPQYLPPDPKFPKEHPQKLSLEQTFTTYDGKTISAATLTSLPDINKVNLKLFSSKLPANTELLLKMPQFGPYKGEIPPPVAEHIKNDSSQSSLLPLTHLKLVSSLVPKKGIKVDEIKAAGSETHEVKERKDNEDRNDEDIEAEDFDRDEQESDGLTRKKRDVKMVQFEKDKDKPSEHFENEEIDDDDMKSFVVFEAVAAANRSIHTYWLTNLTLLLLCLKLS